MIVAVVAGMEASDHFSKPIKDYSLKCSTCKTVYAELSGWRRFMARRFNMKTKCGLHRGRRARS